MKPIEVEYTRRLLAKIGKFFRNEGFDVYDQIVDGSKIETLEGTDALVHVNDKIIGIQVKRLYGNSYRLKKTQHDKIKNRDWVIYAFPDELIGKQLDNILHRTIFSDGNFDYKEQITEQEILNPLDWNKLSNSIKECTLGLKVSDKDKIKSVSGELREFVDELPAILNFNVSHKIMSLITTHEEIIDRRVYRKDLKENSMKEAKLFEKRVNKCPKCGYEF